MKLFKAVTIPVLASLCLCANAITITGPSPSWDLATGTPDPIASGSNDGTSGTVAYLQATYGVGAELYKSDQSGPTGLGVDSGSYAASYVTTFANTPDDPSDALIDYISGPAIAAGPIFLFVKDGNANPGWYLYSFNWDGKEDIILNDFWINPSRGAISHVSIFRGTSVPDGGASAALLGLGLLALTAVRRKKG